MMLLDTNLVREYLQGDRERRNVDVWAFVEEVREIEGITISFVTQFELRRGVELLRRKQQGRRKAVALIRFLEHVTALGLDYQSGMGWDVAANLWARGRSLKPAVVFSEGDLLIAATALAHRRTLATADQKLADCLAAIEFEGRVRVVGAEK